MDITRHFQALFLLKMHKICVMWPSKYHLDRVLIETDSPYLAPMPYRGKSNEPKYVPYVAKALSDVYGKSIEEMAFITMQNFENLLNLK